MPAGSALISPTQALPGFSAAKDTLSGQRKHSSTPIHELEHLYPSPILQSTTDLDKDVKSTVPQTEDAEDEHTFCAYGEISLSEIIVPPLPASTNPDSSPSYPRVPQPRLRLKLRRPPMPKRRQSYVYMPDPLPHSKDVEPDVHWPGSPRHFVNNPRRQPLVSPVSVESIAQSLLQGNKPLENGGSSLEKLVDELLPHTPSIRLSPPGSPASGVISLQQETDNPENGAHQGWNVAAKPLQSSLSSASRQDKPKEAPWRMRLPPRLPIPKWDT